MTPGELGEWIARCGPALVLYARLWSDAPEDCVQEAFVRLMQVSDTPADPLAWLYRTVRHRAIDRARGESRRRRRESATLKAPWFTPTEMEGLDVQHAVQCLQNLEEEYREVIVARLWGQLTFEQIADAAGVSVSTAYRRFESGIGELRKRMGET